MAALALFDVLPDFGKRTASSVAASMPAEPAAQPQPDIESIVRGEVERAEAALSQRLSQAHAEEIEAMREAHAAEIDGLHRQLGTLAGETIAARLGELQERVGERAAAGAARILGSMLSEELQRRSIESLAETIAGAAADREAVRIEVRGPLSLLEALREALGDSADALAFVESPGFDLMVAIDDDLLETCMAEWSASLSDILS